MLSWAVSLWVLMKRSQVFFNTSSDLIFKIFQSLLVQIYLYMFDLAPIEDETRRYISNLRVSFGLGLNSDTESRNSWEQLKVLALLLQSTDTYKLSPEMLTACCKVTWWLVVELGSRICFVSSIPAQTIFPLHNSISLFLQGFKILGVSFLYWLRLYSILASLSLPSTDK